MVKAPVQTKERTQPPKAHIVEVVMGCIGVVIKRIRIRIVVINPSWLIDDDRGRLVVRYVNNVFLSGFDHNSLVFHVDGLFIIRIDVACGIRLLADILNGCHQCFFLIDNGLSQLPGPVDVVV